MLDIDAPYQALIDFRMEQNEMTAQTSNTATAKARALAAVRICRESCPTLLGARPFLYKKCLEGVYAVERLRPHVKTTDEPFTFCSLRGQQIAEIFASATLDNVLSIVVDQNADQRWRFDIITDVPGLVYGTPEGDPGHETREATEEAAIAGLAMLGRKAVPAVGYVPVPDPDSVIGIVLGDRSWAVPDLPKEVTEELLRTLDSFGRSIAEKAARLADRLAADFDPEDRSDLISLTILANCGWTHVSRAIVDEFCAAHGIDL
jgi:hypothetical protein